MLIEEFIDADDDIKELIKLIIEARRIIQNGVGWEDDEDSVNFINKTQKFVK